MVSASIVKLLRELMQSNFSNVSHLWKYEFGDSIKNNLYFKSLPHFFSLD